MARVLVVVPFPMDADQLALRRAQMTAVRLGPDIEFDFRPVKAAPSNYVSHHDYVLADVGIVEAGMTAEAEGYDAVCIDTMSDSGVAALRSMLDIPVIGPGRASMLTALMLGDRFSVLAMWKQWKPLYAKTVADLGIGHKMASVRTIDVRPDNRNLLSGRDEDIFPLLEAEARRAIEEDGADVILLGSTTMHQAHAHLAARLAVPVINPGPLTYKLAEAVLGLGLRHSRSAYPKPLVAKPEVYAAMLAAAGEAEGRKKP